MLFLFIFLARKLINLMNLWSDNWRLTNLFGIVFFCDVIYSYVDQTIQTFLSFGIFKWKKNVAEKMSPNDMRNKAKLLFGQSFSRTRTNWIVLNQQNV